MRWAAVGGNNEALIARIREATRVDLYELKPEDLKERCRKKGPAVARIMMISFEHLKEAMEAEKAAGGCAVGGGGWTRVVGRRARRWRRRRRRTCRL